MKLKVPPALVLVIFGVLMYLLAKFLPVGYFEFFGKRYLMYGLAVIAVGIGVISLVQFFKSKTSIDPSKPSKASSLVTSGMYTFSRNPMYLGLLLILLAWALWLGNAFNLLLVAGFVGYMNRFQIIPEEEVLLKMFGSDFKKYCSLTRRWF